MNFDDVRKIAFLFPGIKEHLAFGRPTLRVGERFLACIAKIDPDTLVLKVPDQREREFLLTTKPDIYYMVAHYINFECVLVRIPNADEEELRGLIEQTWRTFALKRHLKNYPATD